MQRLLAAEPQHHHVTGCNSDVGVIRALLVCLHRQWAALQHHLSLLGVTCICCGVSCMQGFAYVEFMEADAVDNAIMLDNTELRGRPIKVNKGLSTQ
jgi:hypothetical protein